MGQENETVELFVGNYWQDRDGWMGSQSRSARDQVKITFDVIGGVIDLASIRAEKIEVTK